jgi:drug/metabolite transporter (DMT)-like permease
VNYRTKAYLFLLVSAVISGIAGLVLKLTLDGISVEVFLFYRFFISSVAVIFLLPFVKLKIPKKPSVLLNFLLFGFLNTTVALGFLFLGASHTTLLNLSLITLISPLLAIFAGYLLLHEHISKRLKIGILVSVLGAFTILIGPFIRTGDNLGEVSGNIFILISVFAGVYSTILVKKLLRQGADPLSLTNASFVIGFISFLIIIFIKGDFENSINIIKNLPLSLHLGVFYMALISGTLAYYLGTSAQRSIEVSEAAVFSYIPSVIASILAILVVGDPITPEIVIGTVITLVGVYLAETRKRRYN